MLLLLLHHLDGDVLALLPVNVAALTLDDLGTLEAERVCLVRLTLHLVVLRQHRIGEVLVGSKVELEHKALWEQTP